MEDLSKVKTITPYEASKVIPVNAEKIRAGLRQGIFPFGVAIQNKKGGYSYIIYEKKFREYVEENN